VPQVYVEDHRVKNLDPNDPLWVGRKKPSKDHPTGVTHRDQLKMDWSHGHNHTVHNGIGRIGYYTGGHKARWRDEDLADEWVKQSVRWIEAHKDEPFFLFFSSHDIHVPRMPHERFQGKTPHGYRGDAIIQLDWCVGELLKTLDRLDLSKKTLVVFCSDNGPVLDDGYKDGAREKIGSHKPAGPFRGGKYSIFEGGTRTPFITWWPGRIQPGVSDQIVCTIDLAASMAAITGQKLPGGACLDSFDVSAALLGKKGAEGRDHLVQQSNRASSLALRVGDWKILEKGKRKGRKQAVPKSSISLFNLAEDPGEKKNLAEEHPQKLKELQDKLTEIRKAGRTRP
ncbi:MAG: sulfatase-like hydrolase/transferase, partial [Phycisphaeraceae bacterium]|nr:sulfatase-like hydrolase/transferase [Phycisphaeraceae bacterium]